MAKKPTISTISSGYYSRQALNNNLEALRDAFDNTLSLDGSLPNAMQADLDFNHNSALNVDSLQAKTLTVGGSVIDLDEIKQNADDSEKFALQAEASAVEAALYEGPWLDDVATLISDTSLTYTTGQPGTVMAGAIVRTRAEGFSYEVADSAAVDHHVTTAGGVKLYVLNPEKVESFNPAADGATNDKAEIDAALSAASGFVDLGGKSYAYNAALAEADANRIFNGTIIDSTRTLVFRGPELRNTGVLGAINTPSFVAHQDWNVFNSSLSAASILGGTRVFPQRIGLEYHVDYFTGDGSNTAFNVTAPFTINDLDPAQTVTVLTWRVSDSLAVKLTPSSITGYGTTTITVNLSSAPASGDIVEILVFGSGEDGSADPTLVTTMGYDNAVNPIMSNALGAHGLIANGGGHNSILGGSYGRVYGSYNTVCGGIGNVIGYRDSTSIGAVIAGRSNRVDGDSAVVLGFGNDIQGNYSVALGREHENNEVEGVAQTGRSSAAVEKYERVHGGSTLTEGKGRHQVREGVLHLETTDATEQFMDMPGGGGTVLLEADCAYVCRVDVVAIMDDKSKSEAWSLDFHIYTDSGGVARINGSASDVALTSIHAVGSPTWAAEVRCISGEFAVRVTGAASETIRWTAHYKLVQAQI